MKKIMKRAWEIYRTLTGDHVAKLSMALKMAWAETKTIVKKVFNGFAKVAKVDNADETVNSDFLTFKGWEKYGRKRVYINDYKKRTLGYIEDGEVVINDRQGNYQSEIDTSIANFKASYVF